MLAAKSFRWEIYVRYYFLTLAYTDLTQHQYPTLMYGEHIMEVTRKAFQNWASWLHEKVVDRDNVEQNLWIVQAPFHAMRYINDVW